MPPPFGNQPPAARTGRGVPRPQRGRAQRAPDFRRPEAPPVWSTPEDEERTGLFRQTLTVAGHRFDLVARQPVGGRWAAWVQRSSVVEEMPTLPHALLLAGEPVASLGDVARGLTATGTDAAEAFGSLAEAIRDAVTGAGGPGWPS